MKRRPTEPDAAAICDRCGQRADHHQAQLYHCPTGEKTKTPFIGRMASVFHKVDTFSPWPEQPAGRDPIRVPVDVAIRNLTNEGSSENSWNWDLEIQGASYHFTVTRDSGKRIVSVHGAAGYAEEIGRFNRKSGLDAMFRGLKISVAWLEKREAHHHA